MGGAGAVGEAAAMTTQASSIAPIALGSGEGEKLWFLGGLVTVKATAAGTGGRVAVLEHLVPRGAGSPLHVHHDEDEWFHVLEGELTVWVSGEAHVAGPGGFVFLPKGIPHTFLVSSDVARFLLVTGPAGFEGFVREIGVPAERPEIPPAATEPPDVEGLTRVAARYGMDIIGPPGIPA
jgi:quercetin dioxygenase-like cupin family protein